MALQNPDDDNHIKKIPVKAIEAIPSDLNANELLLTKYEKVNRNDKKDDNMHHSFHPIVLRYSSKRDKELWLWAINRVKKCQYEDD